MLFSPCSEPGCPRLADVRGFCLRHYHHRKHLERQARAVQFDPADATAAISACLKKFRTLHEGGILDRVRFTALQHEFLGYSRQLMAVVENDFETNEMAEADDQEYTQWMIKLRGAVEAESPEEAKKLLEERKQQKLTGEVKHVEHSLGPGLTGRFPEKKAGTGEKKPFLTGDKAEDMAS